MKKNLSFLQQKKIDHIPITVLTAYDYPTAQLEDHAGVDIILIGDSVGTNILGYDNETQVTLNDMAHHLRAVKRGVKESYIMVDMPFGSAEDPFQAYENAQFLTDQGADCVKIEGWKTKKNIIANLAEKGINVCAHIGYNPQIHGTKGAIYGKTAEEAMELLESAQILQNAGASIILAEKIPEEVIGLMSEGLTVPVIGIGSGKRCDGQVLVINDIVGLTPKVFRHVHKYVDVKVLIEEAIRSYCNDVVSRMFPFSENFVHIDSEELKKIKNKLRDKC